MSEQNYPAFDLLHKEMYNTAKIVCISEKYYYLKNSFGFFFFDQWH